MPNNPRSDFFTFRKFIVPGLGRRQNNNIFRLEKQLQKILLSRINTAQLRMELFA